MADEQEIRILDRIDSLVNLAKNNIPQSRWLKLHLYAEGLKAKITQVRFALEKLSDSHNRTLEVLTDTAPEEFSIDETVHFYCDTFWTFLYSTLDVLGQIVNQSLKLGLLEKHVGFKSVHEKLQGKQYNTTVIAQRVHACIRSLAFRNLDKYRNCSTHRRQIYILAKTTSLRGTSGYHQTSTNPVSTVVRTICDDPLDMSPKINQGRQIPDYMIKTRGDILSLITLILEATNHVK